MSCRDISLNALVSCLNKFLVQVLVGCLLTSCLVLILGWPRTSDAVFFWVFFGALDLVMITVILLRMREISGMYKREIVGMYSYGTTGWKRTTQSRSLTPNLLNTVLTAALTGAILPILFWTTWRPSLLREVLVLTRDQVVSGTNILVQ